MSSILKVDTIQNTGGTTGLTIDSNGFVLPKAVAFSAYMSGTQSISASTWTKVTFNTEEFPIGCSARGSGSPTQQLHSPRSITEHCSGDSKTDSSRIG